jgi:DNA-binding transcriptional LysR family regulator
MARPLASLNLNLLVSLDALLQECSVTRAAKLTGVTQSAMSHTLAALRDHFGDPLLARGGRGMELTPRARQLADPLRRALIELEQIVEAERHFDPANTTRQFRVVTGDFVAATLAPSLCRALARAAPHARLVIAPFDRRTLDTDLERGSADLAIGPRSAAGDELCRVTLRDDPFLCVVSADHSLARADRLTLDDYTSYPHLLVSPTGSGAGIVDELLEARGRSRRVVCRVASFAIAPLVAARAGLLLTAPESSVLPHRETLGLVTFDPPLAIPPLRLEALWHPRNTMDTAHRWLRTLVKDTFVAR